MINASSRLPVQPVGKPAHLAFIQGHAVIIKEIKRDVLVMPQQAFLDQAVVASPAAGHQYAVVMALFLAMQDTADRVTGTAQRVGIDNFR